MISALDPITAELVASALVYASEEMGIAVRDAAYSPNIKERLDHSCALFDAQARLVAQAEHIRHGINAWLLRARPQRRADRAAGKDHSIFRAVGKLDPFGRPGKDCGVVPDHAASAQRCKADVPWTARAGVAVACPH